MKHFFKTLLTLSVVLLLILSISSCTEKEEESAVIAPNQPMAQVTPNAQGNPENNDGNGISEEDAVVDEDYSIDDEEDPSDCEHVYEEKILIAATCQKSGVTKMSCTLCDYYTHVTVDKIGHTEVIDAAVLATCTTPGKTAGKHCSVCNTVLEAQKEIASTGHTIAIDPATPATCTDFGKTEGKHCSVCNAVLLAQTPINVLAHTEIIDPAISATCTTPGKTEGKHCGMCNKVLVAQATINPPGHIEEIDSGVSATCTTPGKTEGKHCRVCNTVLVAQEDISATGHTEVTDAAVPATCNASGKTEGSHCGTCNTVFTPQEIIPATGHSMNKRTITPLTCTTNGVVESYCSNCEYKSYDTVAQGHYSEDHEYASIQGLCTIFGHGDCCDECGSYFIAPGTYTISFGNSGWTGGANFAFEYTDASGTKRTGSRIYCEGRNLEIDGVAQGRVKSLVIKITEESLVKVSSDFYYDVFLYFFEKGEYTLSGYYTLNMLSACEDLYNAPIGTHYMNFTYYDYYGNEFQSSFIHIVKNGEKYYLNYSSFNTVLYNIAVDSDYTREISSNLTFESPQTVSKEFFEWFTSHAYKY